MDYQLTHSLNKKHIAQLVALYQNEWWSTTRTITDVKTMLTHTDLVFVVLNKDDDLIGFARILTDTVYFATIFDVIIAKKYRNQHLGFWLMESIKKHPIIKHIEYLECCCRDEIKPFYKKLGFSEASGRMQIKQFRT